MIANKLHILTCSHKDVLQEFSDDSCGLMCECDTPANFHESKKANGVRDGGCYMYWMEGEGDDIKRVYCPCKKFKRKK